MDVRNIQKLEDQVKRYSSLLRFKDSFHSKLNIVDLLNQLLEMITLLYPTVNRSILLANDAEKYANKDIKEFIYDFDIENGAVRAFLKGTIQKSIDEKMRYVYIPIKGNQGVYGVLNIEVPITNDIENDDVEFIIHMIDTVGIALENAKLLQQSQQLVKDLQLLNDLSHRLNSSGSLTDAIVYVVHQVKSFMNGEEVGFIINENNHFRILSGSTDYFYTSNALQIIERLNTKIIKENNVIFTGNGLQELEGMHPKYESIMAVPMIQSGERIGLSIVLQKLPYAFSFDAFKLFQSLIQNTSLAVRNVMLREELEQLVITDHLTKLYSRKYLDEQIHLLMRTTSKGVFLLLDIDNFKGINDTYGHQIGDDVLIQIGEILKKSIRQGDIAARWGGEELAIYFPNISLEVGKSIAERIRYQVKEKTTPQTTVSIGLSYWTLDKIRNVKELFQCADEALYKAKTSGKDQVRIIEVEGDE